jgi:hypothetical protein
LNVQFSSFIRASAHTKTHTTGKMIIKHTKLIIIIHTNIHYNITNYKN